MTGMATTLYRKYRPQRFEDLIGQDRVRDTLVSEIETGAIAHAYLFVGPRGVGKTTTARIFAKAVNCTSRKGAEPDNSCPSCRTMNEGRSLDLIEIDAASHTQVDHVREHILPAARTAPASGTYKVFIIDEVHMLSVSAFNALLKMLEEPPAHALFVLATTEPHRVPETIISRCQRFDFHRVGVADIVKRLERLTRFEKASVEKSVHERIARASDGSLRDAENLLGILLGLGEKTITDAVADLVVPRSNIEAALALLEAVTRGDTREALALVQRMADEGVRITHFMHEIVELARGLVLMAFGIDGATPPASKENHERMKSIISRVSPETLRRILDRLVMRERDMRTASIPQLPLELAVVELAASDAAKVTRKAESGDEGEGRGSRTASAGQKGARKADTGMSLRTADVLQQWPKILETVASSNPSVAFLLKTAEPCDIVDGTLTLAFPYRFHSEQAMDPRNKRLIEEALRDTVGIRMVLAAKVAKRETSDASATPAESIPPRALPDGGIWQDAVHAFGTGLSTEQEHP